MTDPVSWKAIERGAKVFASDGEAVGEVSKVVGDVDADVFTGLALSIETFGHDRFVPSERVAAIYPDRVDLALTKPEVERLPEHKEAREVHWRPEDRERGFLSRLFGRR